MDKKSTVNDLYKGAVISVFVIGYSVLGKKDTKDCSSMNPDVRSGRHRKAGHCCSCIRDDDRLSH